MLRRIAISDIHGCDAELEQLLLKIKAKPEEVIFLGDYVDTGPDSIDALDRVIEWCGKGAAALMGNHDDLFLQWLGEREIIDYYGGRVGGMATINSCLLRLGMGRLEYSRLVSDKQKEHEVRTMIREQFREQISFLQSLPLFKKEAGLIYVHAGIHPKKGLVKTAKVEFLNLREEFIHEYQDPETVIFGHTPTRRIHKKDEVYFGPNHVIGIDGGCAFGGQLNALLLEDGGFSTVFVKKSEISR